MLLAEAAAAVPHATSAMDAEAWGLKVGLDLVAAAGARVPVRRLEVYGDNLAVVRFGAGTGRVQGPHVCGLVSSPLARSLGLGWDMRWHAVRRRFNSAADAAATVARDRGTALALTGARSPEVTWRWA